MTALAGFGVACFVAMFVFGLLATQPPQTSTRNLPQYTGGVTAAKIAASRQGRVPARRHSHNFLGDLFSTTVFPFMLVDAALPVHRLPVLGVHRRRGARQRPPRRADRAARRARDRRARQLASTSTRSRATSASTRRSAGARSYWGFNENLPVLPLGQPNSMPLLAVIANTSLWPIWALISLGGRDVPVPAVPGLHQLHQPHAARVEPRPPGAGVVRRGERAHPRRR